MLQVVTAAPACSFVYRGRKLWPGPLISRSHWDADKGPGTASSCTSSHSLTCMQTSRGYGPDHKGLECVNIPTGLQSNERNLPWLFCLFWSHCMYMFVWFCSDNTLGHRRGLNMQCLALWDGDIIMLTQCTLPMLYNGKGKKSLWLSLFHLFLPTGKGGCRGSVCRGHSLRLPEGPRGKYVSQTGAQACGGEHSF